MATHEYMNVQVDIDGGGKLDLFEFFRAMVEKGPALALSLSHEELAKRFKISEKDVERIRSNFCEHDDDGSGTVDVEELAQILHEMGVDLKPLACKAGRLGLPPQASPGGPPANTSLNRG